MAVNRFYRIFSKIKIWKKLIKPLIACRNLRNAFNFQIQVLYLKASESAAQKITLPKLF